MNSFVLIKLIQGQVRMYGRDQRCSAAGAVATMSPYLYPAVPWLTQLNAVTLHSYRDNMKWVALSAHGWMRQMTGAFHSHTCGDSTHWERPERTFHPSRLHWYHATVEHTRHMPIDGPLARAHQKVHSMAMAAWTIGSRAQPGFDTCMVCGIA